MRAGRGCGDTVRVHRGPVRPGPSRVRGVRVADDPEEYLGVAYEVAGRPVAALQLVLADRNGAWPWDAWSTEGDLPVLGTPPTADAGRDVELLPADVRRAQGW